MIFMLSLVLSWSNCPLTDRDAPLLQDSDPLLDEGGAQAWYPDIRPAGQHHDVPPLVHLVLCLDVQVLLQPGQEVENLLEFLWTPGIAG